MASHRNKQDAPERGSPTTRRSRSRRFLLLLLPYAVAFGLLWLVNLALPIIDSSLDVPFTRDIQLDGVTYREINRNHLEPFFPAGSPLIPELKNSLLRPAKAQNSLRVLCLGESSMFGVPFAFSATIPSLVRKQLRRLYPDRDIEVINLAASAINSNVIREMVPQFLSLNPDLVLIYTGHNEFYGPDGIGASWLERQIPGLTKWKYRARRLPLVMLLQRWIGKMGAKHPQREDNLMRQVSGGAEVRLNSPEAERIAEQFRDNLHALVHDLHSRGIPVILGEISSNLMFPPFAPHGPDADPLPSAVTSGRFGTADSLIMAGLAADSANAYYLYWRGRLNLARGDEQNAVRDLGRARDEDLLKFRAPGRMNEIIREVGNEESVPVLPIDSLLRARSPHGVTDGTFFCEHLHPTFSGYDLIARAYVQAIVDHHFVPSPLAPLAHLLPFNADSLSVPWLDLGYGTLGLRTLTSQWPFTQMPRGRDLLDTCQTWELEIAKQVYAGRVGWTDALLDYAKKAKEHNKPAAMVTAFAALVEEYPDRPMLQYGLATALENVGRMSDAVEHYRRTISLRPDLPEPRVDLAFLLIDRDRYEEAQPQLQAVLNVSASGTASNGPRAMALYGLAFIAANHDSIKTALALVDESLRLAPGYPAALSLKSEILSNNSRR